MNSEETVEEEVVVVVVLIAAAAISTASVVLEEWRVASTPCGAPQITIIIIITQLG